MLEFLKYTREMHNKDNERFTWEFEYGTICIIYKNRYVWFYHVNPTRVLFEKPNISYRGKLQEFRKQTRFSFYKCRFI